MATVSFFHYSLVKMLVQNVEDAQGSIPISKSYTSCPGGVKYSSVHSLFIGHKELWPFSLLLYFKSNPMIFSWFPKNWLTGLGPGWNWEQGIPGEDRCFPKTQIYVSEDLHVPIFYPGQLQQFPGQQPVWPSCHSKL